MASIIALGGGPEFSADLTIIMNRIVISPIDLDWKLVPGPSRPVELGLYYHVEREAVKSTGSVFFSCMGPLLELCLPCAGGYRVCVETRRQPL
jgi:hypothetical protein